MPDKKITYDYLNSESYLLQFWPEDPKATSVWEENRWLLEQYVSCAQKLNKKGYKNLSALEISTGPILSPLIPFTELINEIQLSDYDSKNRLHLSTSDIDYWYDYVSEVIKIEKGIDSKKNISERLKKLNSLRSKNIVAHVDIKRKSNQMFEPSVDYSKYNFLIMHFVVDSITDTKNSYFELLDTVIKKIIKKGDLFLMSALVECTTWDDGEKSYPSANISTKEIIERLKLLGAEIITHSEKIHKAGVGHNGGFAVILASF